jgi:hypothetical protein
MSDLEDKIIALLQDCGPLRPQEIAHLVGFEKPNNTASKVNPTLYKLKEEGRVVRTEGNKPVWSLVSL